MSKFYQCVATLLDSKTIIIPYIITYVCTITVDL